MTPLHAARKLAETDPFVNLWSHSGNDYWCFACGVELGMSHEPTCPILAVPRIIAALTASEDACDEWQALEDATPLDGPMARLRDALTDEEVTP